MSQTKRYIAEFLCTLLIVTIAAGAVVADTFFARAHLTDSSGALTIAFAYGLTTMIVLATIGRMSGGYGNPAVALGLLLTRRLSGKEAGGLILMQLLGGAAAGGVVWAMSPHDAFVFTAAGAPGLATGVSIAQGVAVEMVGTFLVTLAIWGTSVDERGPSYLGPVAAGLAVTAAAIAAGPFTGGALNPARWLGPALASRHFVNWPVWLAGPFLGGILGALVYENFVADQRQEAPAAEDAGEAPDEAVPGRALPAGSAPADVIVPANAGARAARTSGGVKTETRKDSSS
jgi:MIP family channel proteins